jgi:hypothetical protein
MLQGDHTTKQANYYWKARHCGKQLQNSATVYYHVIVQGVQHAVPAIIPRLMPSHQLAIRNGVCAMLMYVSSYHACCRLSHLTCILFAKLPS